VVGRRSVLDLHHELVALAAVDDPHGATGGVAHRAGSIGVDLHAVDEARSEHESRERDGAQCADLDPGASQQAAAQVLGWVTRSRAAGPFARSD